jgi:hypothetical protein
VNFMTPAIHQLRAKVGANVPKGGRPHMRERPIWTFADCLYECGNTPGFVAQFHRLTGSHLTPRSAPDRSDARAFAASADAYVWQPLLAYEVGLQRAED